MRLADDKGERVELFGATQLRSAVLDRLPELEPQLDPDLNVHAIVAALGRSVMDATDDDTLARARSISTILDALLDRRDLDPEIPNAIAISFVMPDEIQATAQGRQIWQDMSERLRRLVEANLNDIG